MQIKDHEGGRESKLLVIEMADLYQKVCTRNGYTVISRKDNSGNSELCL